jgi:hypothetical protein
MSEISTQKKSRRAQKMLLLLQNAHAMRLSLRAMRRYVQMQQTPPPRFLPGKLLDIPQL